MHDAPPEPGVVAAVLASVDAHGGLPSTGHTLARLTRLLERDDEALGELANLILADPSLTQRLLGLANTIPYRTASGPVTTVTRAIALLGFDRVRAIVVSVVLLDGLLAPGQGAEVHAAFRQALLAGRLARELLLPFDAGEAEEASIAAMFRHVGRLLLSVFAPASLAAVRQAAGFERPAESAAARRLLGTGLDELNATVLARWHVPDRIVLAVGTFPARIEPPRAPADRMRAVAQLADELAGALCRDGAGALDLDPQADATAARVQPALDRFAPALLVGAPRIGAVLSAAFTQVRDFEVALGLVVAARRAPPPAAPLDGLLLPPDETPSAQRDAAGRPENSEDLLLAGLAEATELLARALSPGAGGGRLGRDAVARVVLESLYRALGFERAALLVRDAGRGVFVTRMTVGRPPLQLQLPVAEGPDLLRTAIARGSDIYLQDVSDERLRQRLPEPLLRLVPDLRCLLVMPLVAGARSLGALVACRRVPDPAGAGRAELQLLRSLRAQVLLALGDR